MEGKALQKWAADAMPVLPAEITSETVQYFVSLDGTGGQGDDDSDDPDAPNDSKSVAIKVVLFATKAELPFVYKAMAYRFRALSFKFHGLAFGWVQSNTPDGKALMKQFGVTQAPKLLLVSMEPDEKGIKAGMQPYEGPMRYANMVDWLDIIIAAISRTPPGGVEWRVEGSGLTRVHCPGFRLHLKDKLSLYLFWRV